MPQSRILPAQLDADVASRADPRRLRKKALGPRNPAYRILGIEFTTEPRPRTWYPDFGNGLESIIVQLSQAARRDRGLALFQLGHEAFHLIEPIKPGTLASYLEEGLASYFAVDYMAEIGIADGGRYIAGENYRQAYDMVVQVASLHRGFYRRIRQLRERRKSFSRVSADDIRAALPKASTAIARRLAQPFR